MTMTKEELIIEEMINEEIKEYLQSGYSIDDEYIITLKNILKKLGLKDYSK